MNVLFKKYRLELVTPGISLQWENGYSTFMKGSGTVTITNSNSQNITSLLSKDGINYIENYLNSRGYVISLNNTYSTPFNILNSTGSNYSKNGLLPLIPPYLAIGRFAHFIEGVYTVSKGIGYPDPFEIPEYFFTVPISGAIINIKGFYASVKLNPYYNLSPIIGWNAGATSKDSFYKTGEIEFSIVPYSSGVFIGLVDSIDAYANNHYNLIKYGFLCENGSYRIFINTTDTKRVQTQFKNTDIFKIALSEKTVFFYVNNILIHTSIRTDTFSYIKLTSSLYNSGDTITNVFLTAKKYANITLNYNNTVKLLSKNYSELSTIYSYTVLIKNNPTLNSAYSFKLNLMSLNFSIINTAYSFKTLLKSFSGLLLDYSFNSKVYSGKVGHIEINYKYTVDVQQGTLLPALPANITLSYEFFTYIRDSYRLQPTIFIST